MRLIDADYLKEKGHYDDFDVFVVDYDDIKNAPTVDPVKHGRWEWIGGYGYQYRCSECIMCAERPTNYCPNCGALMDEEGV